MRLHPPKSAIKTHIGNQLSADIMSSCVNYATDGKRLFYVSSFEFSRGMRGVAGFEDKPDKLVILVREVNDDQETSNVRRIDVSKKAVFAVNA